MSTRVYRYGLLPPTSNGEVVREQMSAAHRYRNTLVEIERGRRAALRALQAEHEPRLVALEADARAADDDALEAARAIKAQRSSTRKRSATDETRNARAMLTAARARRKAAVDAFREARRRLAENEAYAATAALIDERAAWLRRNARAYCGTYWGTYLLIEDADQAARRAPLHDGAEPNDPRFVRWTGEGMVGVQIQGGMPAAAVFGSDTRLRIAPVDERAWQTESRSERRRLSRTEIRLRVGSDASRDPVWAAWPMTMHRPLPDGAIIKRAAVSLRRHGPREEWSVEITVDVPDERRLRACGTGAVAIDLGWRLMPEGDLRVASWVASDGERGELRLPARLIGGFTKPEDLRSIRDKWFDLARDSLLEHLHNAAMAARGPAIRDLGGSAAMAARSPAIRDASATASMANWRSPARLAALARRWREDRIRAKAEHYGPLEHWTRCGGESPRARLSRIDVMYFTLEDWHYKDRHLWEWESAQRISSLRHRREVYRVFAAAMARKYETLVLEDFDLRRVARRAPVDAEKAENETSRHSRQIAAVSELRRTLREAFESRRGVVEDIDAAYTTQQCHHCRHVDSFNAAEHLQHRCSSCGCVWDQDENAARNLLERFREQPKPDGPRDGAKTNDPAAPKESRWARAKRLRREKELARKSARESACDAAE